MHIEYMLLANDSSIDQEKNTLSVFNLIEDLDVRSNLPQINFPLQVIVSICRESESGPMEGLANLRVDLPTGSPFEQVLPLKMLAEHRRYRFRINTVIPISATGAYKFVLSFPSDRDNKKEMTLNIRYERGVV